jgi:tetratricopeptide (TPR) repeat protein
MKRLLVCLLLVGVVGCGTSPSPEPPHVDTDVEKAKIEYAKGNHFAERKDWATAIACFTKAIEFEPNSLYLYAHRASAYYSQRNLSKAIDDCTRVIEGSAKDDLKLKVLTTRGKCYRDSYDHSPYQEGIDKDSSAIADFTEVIRLGTDPAGGYSNRDQVAYAYYNRGRLYRRQKRMGQAKTDLDIANEMGFIPDPEDWLDHAYSMDHPDSMDHEGAIDPGMMEGLGEDPGEPEED